MPPRVDLYIHLLLDTNLLLFPLILLEDLLFLHYHDVGLLDAELLLSLVSDLRSLVLSFLHDEVLHLQQLCLNL